MKAKKEEESAILKELVDIVEDTKEIKIVHSYHYKNLLLPKKAQTQIETEVEDIIDQATIAREIICYNKKVKPILKITYIRLQSKLKMNKANDVSGRQNELIKHAGKDLESSILKIFNEVARHASIPKD